MKNTNEKYNEEIIEERFNGYDVYDPFEGEVEDEEDYDTTEEDPIMKEKKTTLRPDMAYSLAAKYHISPKEAHDIVELARKYNLTFEDIVYIRDTINGAKKPEEYQLRFLLEVPVLDYYKAKAYLIKEDMATYLKDSLKEDGHEETAEKILSIEWILEENDRGRTILKTSESLSFDEKMKITEWIKGQNSDGLGEGFEQQDWANYNDSEKDELGYDIEDNWVMASIRAIDGIIYK